MNTPFRQREFGEEMQPHYNEVAAIEAAGFEDDSWHNDVCVSFVRPILFEDRPECRYIKIWSDARDPGEREMQGARFLVCVYDECEETAELYRGDSLDDALEAIEGFDPTEPSHGKCGCCDHIESSECIGAACHECGGRGMIEAIYA